MTLAVPPTSGPAADEPTGSSLAAGTDEVDHSGPAVPGDSGDDLVVGAVGRLSGEFSGRVGPRLLVRVVRDCRRDLGGSPVGAMPELVERLARYRLDRHIG